MLKECLLVSALVFCATQVAPADTIQLKDKAAVTGRILAEKHDQVVVDIGYTVLVIPRNQVVKVTKSDPAEPAVKAVDSPKPATETDARFEAPPRERSGTAFYAISPRALPARSVRELVNQLGEAVVQVRTPSGLGS